MLTRPYLLHFILMSSRSVDDLLSSLGERESVSTEARFIYGVSSRSGHSFFQRLNDFWIDHQKVPLKEKAYFFHLLLFRALSSC